MTVTRPCYENGWVLLLAATPIGNLGDASRRLIETLGTAEVIAAEHTRTAVRLLRALGIGNRPRLIALHEHNERDRAAELVELARETDLLVLSDAGMPTVSDPGFILVQAAIAAGVVVSALPGPSAVLMALAVSGLPTDRFAFEGFLPRKGRLPALRALASETRTLVFFESPHRIGDALRDLVSAFGPERPAAVCRELTKLHEEVARGMLAELAERFSDGARGEIVIVVGGAEPATASLEDGVARVAQLVAEGSRLKDAAAEVADRTGLSRRELYEAALRTK
jgi:16S rRNA (cytidine1402-2'-O)-methyltransferase